MAENLPSFSILICNYNYAGFIGQAIRSALEQDYPVDRFEVVVVDDGSTDNSREVIESFRSAVNLVTVFQNNRGQSGAFEAAVNAAHGDYVCLLDSDDLFLPDKLPRVAAALARLAAPADEILLCNDLFIEDSTAGTLIQQSWFDVVGISRLPDQWTLSDPIMDFPYSIPCGLVFSRPLIAKVLTAMPTWAFPRSADGVICPAAFMRTGRIHYLREKLGTYRIHGGNEFGGLVNGIYVPKLNWRERTPRTLRFLYEWLDLLDLPAPQRAEALGFLLRLEHRGRTLSESRQLPSPAVNVRILATEPSPASSHDPARNLQSHGNVDIAREESATQPELVRMAEAYARGNSDYIVFVQDGDQLDREFVERHLHWRQHGALVGVSCSDIRLVSASGHLLHVDVFRNSGAWKQDVQQVPPLATGLRDWVAPPVSACMFRRTGFLDRLFAQAHTLPEELQHAGFWLVFQLALHTSGALRLRETLGNCRLPDGAAASYGYLSAPAAADGSLLEPPVELAALWLRQFYVDEIKMFQRWLPAAWHQRFQSWLAAQASGN